MRSPPDAQASSHDLGVALADGVEHLVEPEVVAVETVALAVAVVGAAAALVGVDVEVELDPARSGRVTRRDIDSSSGVGPPRIRADVPRNVGSAASTETVMNR